MSKYEKLGSFVLFEKIEEDKLSKNFIAGQIVNNQIQHIHVVKKFDHSLSTLPDFILDLNQEYEVLKQLANPSIARPNVFVQEKSEFAAVFDYVEGKSLRAVLLKCAQEGYPFTVDHSLLIGSRLCTALEYLHSKKVQDQRLIHGFVCPETIIVSYDGEIKLQYLGLAHALMKFPAGREKFFHDYKNYLAPELLNQQKLDRAVDVFGAGLIFFEMLTGETLFAKGRTANVVEAIDHAQMFTNSGDRVPLPDEIKKVLSQALAVEPSQRYGSIGDMRKSLDLLLFSSEFSPTTFNLAFFMHSLFRESIDEENKSLAGWKKIDVSSYIKEEPPPPPKPEHPVGAAPAKDIPPISPIGMERGASFGQPEFFGIVETKEKSKTPLIIGAVILVAVLGVLTLIFFPSEKPTETPVVTQSALTPEQQKAQEEERTRLETEAQKAQELAKQKDEELKTLQAKLDALLKAQQQPPKTEGGASAAPTVDVAAIKKLQEEAKRLEEEKKKQEALAEQKRKEAQAAPVVAVPIPAPEESKTEGEEPKLASAGTPQVTPPLTTPVETPSVEPKEEPSTPAPAPAAVKEGDEVPVTPDVVKPEVVKREQPTYPPVALKQKIEGTVILSVLISEKGDVIDAKILRGIPGQSGLNEAALTVVKKWKFRPAVKEGKRVRVWMTYPITFKLQ